MAPLDPTPDLSPRQKSLMRLNNSSPRYPLKTYSKRVLQDSYKPPNKRQRVEALEPVKGVAEGCVQPITPILPKKRSISDYFNAAAHAHTPSSTPQSSIISSDPVRKDTESPPSSPPSLNAPCTTSPKIRVRRRLTARLPFGVLKMSSLNVRASKKQRKASPPFMPGSPPRTPYLVRNMGGNTSSEEDGTDSVGTDDSGLGGGNLTHTKTIGIPASRIPKSELITVPFAPTRRYTTRSSCRSVHTSETAERLTGDALVNSQMTYACHPLKAVSNGSTLVGDKPIDPNAMFGPTDGSATLPESNEISTMGRGEVAIVNLANNRAARNDSAQTNIQATGTPGRVSGNLVQSQLDLGVPTNITCNVCKFTFNRTSQEDIGDHAQFHDTYTLGVRVTGLPLPPRTIHMVSRNTSDYIAVVTRSSTQGWKDLAMTVLETHVDKDLGSIAINPDRLWSSIPDPQGTGPNGEPGQLDRYKVYMYVKRNASLQSGRVISLLLAERISTGFETKHTQIEEDEFGAWPSEVVNSPPVVSTKFHEAILGINKFWTIKRERRNGIGRIVLDAARNYSFIPYYRIPRVHVAWTYTTEEGALFARNYLQGEADYDYLTYMEDM